MKTKLILFLTSNYPKNRINKTLLENKYHLFNNIKLLSENDLDNYIKDVINDIINKYGDRGYGYWIWKPYLILQELNKLNDNDILIYFDVHNNETGIVDKYKQIVNYLNTSKKPLIIGRTIPNDYKYTTTKLLKKIEKYLNYKFSKNELLDDQYEAGIIFMKKNNFTINFFKQYFDIMINNIDLISDKYNNDKDNDKTFIDNRHDQSVCSLLSKYYKIESLNIRWEDLHWE